MKLLGSVAAAAVIVTAVGLAASVGAAGDKIAFPGELAVLYATLDSAEDGRQLSSSGQFRELYTSQAALDAARAGQPLPYGTVVVRVRYDVLLDAKGAPVKDANGRLIKTKLLGYGVMEKRAGWGAEYPETVRNGEWEYQPFTAGKVPNTKANVAACFACHRAVQKQDFVFSYDQMRAAKQ